KRLVVDAAAATDHRSPVLEWIVSKAESGAKIIAVTRRARRLQIVVVAQSEAQVQIWLRLHTVLQVEPEDVAGELRVRVAEALIDRARKAEVHLLDRGQGLCRDHRREVGPSQPACLSRSRERCHKLR